VGGFSYVRSTPPAGSQNVPPTVSITSPSVGATLLAGTITLSASASDSDGTVAKVDFFEGRTLIGTATSSPFQVTAQFAPGTHSISAQATDNQGATGFSTPVTFTATASNTPPTVSLTNPSDGASFSGPTNLTLTASASDPDGSVAKVEFFDGQTSLGSVTSARPLI
jgi:hypothetical protein